MRNKQTYLILVITLMMLLLPTLADAQCAMCNATASTANEGDKESALALNSGILFLMGIPYLLLTTLVIVWWQLRKQKKAEQAS